MDNLPEIKIKEVKDIQYSSLDMDVPDEVFEKIVGIGKEEITDSDYFRIGFMAVLEESLGNLPSE